MCISTIQNSFHLNIPSPVTVLQELDSDKLLLSHIAERDNWGKLLQISQELYGGTFEVIECRLGPPLKKDSEIKRTFKSDQSEM